MAGTIDRKRPFDSSYGPTSMSTKRSYNGYDRASRGPPPSLRPIVGRGSRPVIVGGSLRLTDDAIVDTRSGSGVVTENRATQTDSSRQLTEIDVDLVAKLVHDAVHYRLKDARNTWAQKLAVIASENRFLRDELEKTRRTLARPRPAKVDVGVDANLVPAPTPPTKSSVIRAAAVAPTQNPATIRATLPAPSTPSSQQPPPQQQQHSQSSQSPKQPPPQATSVTPSKPIAPPPMQLPPQPTYSNHVVQTYTPTSSVVGPMASASVPTGTLHYQKALGGFFANAAAAAAYPTVQAIAHAVPSPHHQVYVVNPAAQRLRPQQPSPPHRQHQQQQQQQQQAAVVTMTPKPSIASRLPVPIVTVSAVGSGIVLQWTLRPEDVHKCPVVHTYQLFSTAGCAPGQNPASSVWNQIGTVKALALPMQCTLTQFLAGRRYFLAIRAVDAHGNAGELSGECYVDLP